MQTIITNTSIEKTLALLKEKYSSIDDNGCFFAIVRTEYDENGNDIHDFLEVIAAADELGYDYVNTIVYPSSVSQNVAFIDNVKYVVWLSKNHSHMKFLKDAIREKHIWKDVEWGKRSQNYNPKGKDPGNVWIPTEDDGHAIITKHILLDDAGVIDRLLAMSDCGNNYEIYQSDVKVQSLKFVPHIRKPVNDSIFNKVFFKSSEDMCDIENESVKLVVTSPPYWNLKDYFKKGQIGQESYATYLKRMKTVWSECYKKLSPEGSLWININIRVRDGKVIMIPHDFVKICQEIGYFYKGIIIWHKSSGIPTGDKNIVDRHEYVLIFTKSEGFAVDKNAFSSFSDYKNDKLNGRAFWNINRKAGSVGKKYIHPAIFPNDLVERIIKISTSQVDIVVDPFLGSGTSLIAANINNRSFIGYEYNEGFKELMQSRFEAELPNAEVVYY